MMKDRLSRGLTRIRTQPGETIGVSLIYVAIAFLALTCIFPYINILATSFSSEYAIVTGQVGLWPVEFHTNAYKTVLRDSYEMIPVNARSPLMVIYETLPAQDLYDVILSDIAIQGYANVVTSKDPQAAYDQFISEYMASGGEQLIEELTAYYESLQ